MREFSDIQLIEIIDRPENIDSDKRRKALLELNSRDADPDVLKTTAMQVNEKIAYSVIQQDPIAEDTVEMHKSHFLQTDEMRRIYVDQLEKYMRYKDGFRYDVWAHALGGLL